jgi:PRTRC genetic system ThiF family protein
MTYVVTPDRNMQSPKIVVVGCGGTGSRVSEGLCRLLTDIDVDLILVDYDRVGRENLIRQNFFEDDLGKFKARVLAERLAWQYKRKVAYSVFPYDREILNERGAQGDMSMTSIGRGIIIGCVDEPGSRRSIAESLDWGDWWIDAGNGYHSGQVLVGNTRDREHLKGGFNEIYLTVDRVPIPSLQVPTLLMETTEAALRRQNCAEAVMDDLQSPIINQAMAMLVLDIFYKFITGKLTWMGAYIDLEAGSLRPVPAEPVTVARMFGMRVSSLMTKPQYCSRGIMPRPPVQREALPTNL